METARTLLSNLLGYIEEQAKEVDPTSFRLSAHRGLMYGRTDLHGLPGVEFDIKVEGDHIWLRVARLIAHPAPALPDSKLRRVIQASEHPDAEPPTIDEAALKTSLTRTVAGQTGDQRALSLARERAAVEQALREYTRVWEAWAFTERPRRRTIALYGELFATKHQLESEETAKPVEFVWGIGITSWLLDVQGQQHPFDYPLLTQQLEIALDAKTMTIELRPRATDTRFEADAFVACHIAGAADVDRNARDRLSEARDRPVTPFDQASYADVLALAATNLHSEGRYDSTLTNREEIPAPSPQLIVSAAWVLFVRPRTNNYLIEDLHRLTEELETGCEIPDGPAALVTAASDQPVRFESVNFRGLSSRGALNQAVQELYFPLPYNQEQVTIVHQLEQAEGVTVQGPPGTGKTHTIANIICHYLATGRRVLVTSRGEPALEVLQEKIPEEVRPLTVALLTSDREGLRQFQAAIEAIQHRVSQLDPDLTRQQIQTALIALERAHATLDSVDRRLDELAVAQLSAIDIDGQPMRAQQLAEIVVSGRKLHAWFDDTVSLAPAHAPPLTDLEADRLRERRRRLHQDLIYAQAHLPSARSLPTPEEVGLLHEVLVSISQLDDEVQRGSLLPLKATTPDVLHAARQLVIQVDDALAWLSTLDELDEAWPHELRRKCRASSFASERQALEALFTDLDLLVTGRAESLKCPVEFPPEALDHEKTRAAITRASETGKPFGALSFSSPDVKRYLARVKVAGRSPEGAQDWVRVNRHLELLELAAAFSVRWNQLVADLSLPPLRVDAIELRRTEQLATAARSAHHLAANIDRALLSQAQKVFAEAPAHLLGDASQLRELREQLTRHLVRVELSQAATQLAAWRAQLTLCSGPVCDELRVFLDNQLGQPQLRIEHVAGHYAALLAELRRVELLASDFAALEADARRIEQAGAPRLAERLRSVPTLSQGEDPVLPSTWRRAWTWARIRHYLDSIEAREECLALAARRRELEAGLARLYRDVVGKAAWLATKKTATPKVLQALAGYATAIRRIGQGTGPNATRYRRDARASMLDAAAAVPCWIMSHAKVSESMPAEIGTFDLVIVDEASQSNLWALPAILRGAKILVVGDDKQVSPDGGFIASEHILSLRQRFLDDQPYQAEMTPEKSLYDLAARVFSAHAVMLREHFRCAPPIIAYSNRVFYKGGIQPLRIPSASERLDPPLVDIYVEDGRRDSSDCNEREAEVIADEISAILQNERYAGRSIGVVSLLGGEQAKRIDEGVRRRCDVAELLRRRFRCGDARTFQGNERDIMFLSLVSDPSACKALSGLMFEQRFNVAASRARDRMYLVRSVEADQLSDKDLRLGLLAHFNQPVATDQPTAELLIDRCESNFERQVYAELTSRGYRVLPQVKTGAYRLDMVVEGTGDTRLAIECDGDEFHGPERWAADMSRQRVLERAGWTFWRCFASTWQLRQDEVLQELISRFASMGIQPLGAIEHMPQLVEKRVIKTSSVPRDTATDARVVAGRPQHDDEIRAVDTRARR
jgi:very-short-patch-repair endonuclease